jgi:hypothetical protein
MSLQEYLRNGWVGRHEPSRDEILSLLAIADRDIAQSQVRGLAPEWSFDIAYNAMLQCATAALAASGHRAERQNKHMRTIETLAFTVGLSEAEVAYPDACRRKHHTAVYEQVGAVSGAEAAELVRVAKTLRQRASAWLRSEHPKLST